MDVGRPEGHGSVVSPWVGPNWHHLLITDVDNTLFDFGLYAEAGLQTVLVQICELLNLTSEEAIHELREAFRKYNSIEIPFAYEALPALVTQSFEDAHVISTRLVNAFWEGATQKLVAYPGVTPTLAHLWRNGTAIVAVTDAPMWEVWRKLKYLRILKYFAGILAVGPGIRRREPVLQVHDIPEYGKPFRSARRFYRLLGDSDRKPSPRAYQYVLDEFRVSKERITVVGDSPIKDLRPARQLGLNAYWAAYGERNRHLEKLLQAVTPFEPPEAIKSQVYEARSFPKLTSFEEIEKIVDVPQLRLPLGY